MAATDKVIRPHGELVITDKKKGLLYLKDIVKDELGLQETDRTVPFVMDANCVLLIRKGATHQQILKGLDVLREDLVLRAYDPDLLPTRRRKRRRR